MALGTFALGTDAFVISGVLSKVGNSLNVSLGTAGLLITVFSGVYAVSAPVSAVLTGNMCRKRVMQLALLIFVVANVLAVFAPDYAIMVAARVLAAVGAGLYTPSAAAAAAGIAKPEERGRALTLVLGGLTVANAVGVPLGTFIGQAVSWRVTFAIVAALGVIAYAGLTRSLDEIPSTGVVSLRDRISAAAIKGVPSTLLSVIIAICGVFTLYIYLAWFIGRVGGLTGAAITIIYLIFGVTAVVCNFSAGWLIDHMAPARIAALAFAGLVVVHVAFALTAWAGDGSTWTVYVLALLVALWGLTSWLFYPAQQKRLVLAAGSRAPVVLSLGASSLYAGQALAGVLGGALVKHGPASLAIAAAACALIALAVHLAASARELFPAREPALPEPAPSTVPATPSTRSSV
ncbi:MFS transporter [Streptacidiphilus cavernicola]|uniref:MFS transporter n=1 Tax=Streptacidiphilus cavernicola TaxID=3342716 RepID=A0ABV6VQS7_9ACTN